MIHQTFPTSIYLCLHFLSIFVGCHHQLTELCISKRLTPFLFLWKGVRNLICIIYSLLFLSIFQREELLPPKIFTLFLHPVYYRQVLLFLIRLSKKYTVIYNLSIDIYHIESSPLNLLFISQKLLCGQLSQRR